MMKRKFAGAAKVSVLALLAATLGAGGAKAGISVPTITLDGGPLGPLAFSGAFDGYAYALTGTGDSQNAGLLGTDKSVGVEDFNTIFDLQKKTGQIQFDIHFQPSNNLVLGIKPTSPFIQTYPLGPIKAAYLSYVPNSMFTFSAGELFSLEGVEGSADWSNFDLLESSAYWVENGSDLGVQGAFSQGPVYIALQYGDGFDTKVFNYLQGYGAYTFNSNNTLNVYFGTNLGRTGLNALAAGFSGYPYGTATVADYGSNLINSTIVGAYYQFTAGNLSVTPEVQYSYAKPDAKVDITKFGSALTVLVTGGYSFAGTPYSIGALVDYFTSNGPSSDYWYLNTGSEGVGVAVTPTWQKGNLFVRGTAGVVHLTTIGIAGSQGFGASGTGRDSATFALEGGVVF